MINISPSTKIFFYNKPIDIRKSFDGLCGLVINHMSLDPYCGQIFIFINKSLNMMKMLWWDRDGFWIFFKRIEKGRFQSIFKKEADVKSMAYYELVLLIEGVEINNIKKKKRFTK